MRIGRVVGTVTASVKDTKLAGHKMLIVDVLDADGSLIEPSIVAIDNVGAGVGERVLMVCGSAARIPAGVSNIGVDETIVAIIDEISLTHRN